MNTGLERPNMVDTRFNLVYLLGKSKWYFASYPLTAINTQASKWSQNCTVNTILQRVHVQFLT